MKIEADLSGIYGYIGSVDGILSAQEAPVFKQEFVDYIINDLKVRFRAAAIAANASGAASLSHVFEWGKTQSQPSNIPLFRLTSQQSGSGKMLNYYFVPSTKPVPFPDPNKYGFDPNIVTHMKKHIFRYKAIVMESGQQVQIGPKEGKALFIPTKDNARGYVMSKKPVTVNPGGEKATGGFATFWEQWFDGPASEHIKADTLATEQFIAKIGRTVIRGSAGRFSKGQTISAVNSSKRTAELKVLNDSKKFFGSNKAEGENI